MAAPHVDDSTWQTSYALSQSQKLPAPASAEKGLIVARVERKKVKFLRRKKGSIFHRFIITFTAPGELNFPRRTKRWKAHHPLEIVVVCKGFGKCVSLCVCACIHIRIHRTQEHTHTAQRTGSCLRQASLAFSSGRHLFFLFLNSSVVLLRECSRYAPDGTDKACGELATQCC